MSGTAPTRTYARSEPTKAGTYAGAESSKAVTYARTNAVKSATDAPAPQSPPLERALPARVERVYRALAKQLAPERATEIVTVMSRGWRLAGNPAFDASLDLIARRLGEGGFRTVASQADAPAAEDTAAGAERARPSTRGIRPQPDFTQWFEEYSLTNPAWEPVSARISVIEPRDTSTDSGGGAAAAIVLDSAREVDHVSLCINSFSTPEGGVQAPLVFVGRGSDAADYAGKDVRGKIVLGEADAGRLFEQAVRQRGAVGVMSTAAAPYTRPETTPDIVQWSGIRYDEALHGFGFKISPRLAQSLQERLASGTVTLGVDIITRFHQRPGRLLVAEIPGASSSAERVVLVAHVQEPGANDNASGCATLLEIARDLAAAVRRGTIPAPSRTITFIWGDEITESRRWLQADSSRPASVRYAFSLDMTGEDVTKTGGAFLIEKQPDPSAVWLRPSDPHTEWGSSTVTAESLKGSVLNDLHLAVCLRRARDTGWVVKSNPYEGGSDHSVFLASGIPALLDWHFTDRYYHTNLDTPDKTSPAEMANVAVAVATTTWALAAADERDSTAIVGLVEQAALARLALENRQSVEAVREAADPATAQAREEQLFAAWQKWYAEALQSVLTLPAGPVSDALRKRVAHAVDRVRGQVLRARVAY